MTVSVPVRYRRQQRGQFIQKLQHAVPSLMLLQDGFHRLTGELHVHNAALGIVEVVSSGLVIASMIRARLRSISPSVWRSSPESGPYRCPTKSAPL